MSRVEKGHRLRFRVPGRPHDNKAGDVISVGQYYKVKAGDDRVYLVEDGDITAHLGFVPKFEIGDFVSVVGNQWRGQVTKVMTRDGALPVYRVMMHGKRNNEREYEEQYLTLDHDPQCVFRFAVGDRVQRKEKKGYYAVGTVEEAKPNAHRKPIYRVVFGGASKWMPECDIELAPSESPTPPAPKFGKGDLVSFRDVELGFYVIGYIINPAAHPYGHVGILRHGEKVVMPVEEVVLVHTAADMASRHRAGYPKAAPYQTGIVKDTADKAAEDIASAEDERIMREVWTHPAGGRIEIEYEGDATGVAPLTIEQRLENVEKLLVGGAGKMRSFPETIREAAKAIMDGNLSNMVGDVRKLKSSVHYLPERLNERMSTAEQHIEGIYKIFYDLMNQLIFHRRGHTASKAVSDAHRMIRRRLGYKTDAELKAEERTKKKKDARCKRTQMQARGSKCAKCKRPIGMLTTCAYDRKTQKHFHLKCSPEKPV